MSKHQRRYIIFNTEVAQNKPERVRERKPIQNHSSVTVHVQYEIESYTGFVGVRVHVRVPVCFCEISLL